MPNCVAEGCTNSSKKKFKMNSFPRNPAQRAIWIKNIGRKDWVPNNNATLCEVHFAPNMWEKIRVDGSRKLKYNAVPTIFGDRMIEEPSAIQIPTTERNIEINETKILNNVSLKDTSISNNQTILNLISANSNKPQPTSILIPITSILETQSINYSSAVIVDSQSKILNSNASSVIPKGTSLLKPQIKTMKALSSPMIISTNNNVLQSQVKTTNSQVLRIIPASTSIRKPQVLTTNSQQASVNLTNINTIKPAIAQSIIPGTTSILKPQVQTKNLQLSLKNLENVFQGKFVNIQPKLIPMTNNIVKSDVETTNSQKLSIDPTDVAKIEYDHSVDSELFEMKDNNNCDSKFEQKDLNRPITSISKSTGIILNKVEVKKMEKQRFEKMDKLLLKQLKLNNALRRKLNVVNHKMQQLLKEKNSDCRAFLKDVFTEDQIRALQLRHINPKSITPWSYKTMMKATKLKQECGTRGYEELLNQNLPLPSIRTISRWCTARNMPIP